MTATDPKDIIIHVGDTPMLEFECIIKETGAAADISTAETKDIYLKAPLAGTVAKLAGIFLVDGTDGLLKYQALAATFSEHGVWFVEAHIILSDGTVITFSGGRIPIEATLRGT